MKTALVTSLAPAYSLQCRSQTTYFVHSFLRHETMVPYLLRPLASSAGVFREAILRYASQWLGAATHQGGLLVGPIPDFRRHPSTL